MSIAKIKIEGGYFNSPKEFQFFHNHSQVAAVVYGKNGSGKSSISRGFQEALNSSNDEQSDPEFSSVEFYKLVPHPKQGTEFIPTSQINTPCYVHNDNFTLNTVSFNEDGLETIVMFGKQIDIQKDIDNLNKKLKETEQILTNKNGNFDKLSNEEDVDSYKYYEKKIKEKLKNNWAVRYQRIKDTSTKGKVSQQLFEEITKFENIDENYEEIKNNFESELEKYKLIRETNSTIETIEKFTLPDSVHNLIKLLGKKLERPILTKKEQKIYEIFSSLQHNEASESIKFLNSSESTCRLCFQPVDPTYKSSVIETIKKILDTEDANELKKELSNIIIEDYQFDFSSIESFVSKELKDEFEANIEKYNNFINILNNEKQNKIENPYSPITFNEEDLDPLIEMINNNITSINSSIQKFNKERKLKNELLNKLLKINKQLAYLECKDLINIYHDKKNLFENLEKEIREHKTEISKIKTEILNKKASLSNVEIALDLINDYLKYIFYDEKRLYLVPSENKYKIMSRDHPVKPKSLSTGEKNIISLCYFFFTLFQNRSIEELFKEECILILDDPLSSVDFENKVGIYSFLRYILNELHKGNPKSKSIIFTHDLEVLYNIHKVYKDIDIKKKKIKFFSMQNQELKEIESVENFDEYSLLIQKIYKFAAEQSDDFLHIGNNIRRVLEAYATFNYKKGIDQLTRTDEILSKLPEDYRKYFKNSMYRLILNTESHLQERSKLLNSFKEHFSIEEKRRTAKDILLFLYLLDEAHLKFHLKEGNNDQVESKIEKIKTWEKETFKLEGAHLSAS